MYKLLIRPFLFLFNPETAHNLTFTALKFLSSLPGMKIIWKQLYEIKNNKLKRELFGITFPNPVGLAAGLDKDAVLVDEFASFGFGFIEIGTLTPIPQPGNPKPRMFRLPKDNALINRMGFNNKGVHAAVENLKKRKSKVIIGGNIGKNKITPNEEAYKDYEIAFDALYNEVDYFVVNVSSPNTPGLRELQEKGPLLNILKKLKSRNKEQPKEKPILLKIAPDLNNAQLDDIITIVKESEIDGVIATNTTISRENLKESKQYVEGLGAGGLSGRPLRARSTEVVKYLVEKSGNAFPVIAVGGIHSGEDAVEKLRAGASLIQVYTGFIYEGPDLVKEINNAILHENI